MTAGNPTDAAIPILASLDFDQTMAFYGELGFRTAGLFDDYAIVRRGGIEIHFWKCEDRHIAENTACYIRVTDADGLHAEFASRDLPGGRLGEIADRPWQMREFAVWDPHGNLLRVGQEIGI